MSVREEMKVAGKQTVRQGARRKVAEALAAKRAERAEREKLLSDAAVELLTALAERDEAVAEAERVAGAAVKRMLDQGLTMSEVAEYCGGELDAKDLTRLSRAAG